MELTPADRDAFAGRADAIDYPALETLHYLGNYTRSIPVNLNRMMENAYDWEHLPFVHPSSFGSIAIIEEGAWGWRAKTGLPAAMGGGSQLIELLVDKPNHYWATTVVEGQGQGVQIHTQATSKSDDAIDVDVRFYLPQRTETPEQSAMILAVLQTQYTQLYDEDEALMLGRQRGLDERKAKQPAGTSTVSLGLEAHLDRERAHAVELANGRFVVRHHAGRWIAHAARCPHMLAPLSDAAISADGVMTCPWHGYRFGLVDGAEQEGRCGALPEPPAITISHGELIVGG